MHSRKGFQLHGCVSPSPSFHSGLHNPSDSAESQDPSMEALAVDPRPAGIKSILMDLRESRASKQFNKYTEMPQVCTFDSYFINEQTALCNLVNLWPTMLFNHVKGLRHGSMGKRRLPLLSASSHCNKIYRGVLNRSTSCVLEMEWHAHLQVLTDHIFRRRSHKQVEIQNTPDGPKCNCR